MSKTKRISSLSELVVEQDIVGAVIQQDYENMLIATSDYRQMLVGGVPKNGFLTVAVPDENNRVAEVILLSVEGPVPMQTQRELIQVREELASRQLTDTVIPTLDAQTETRLGTQALRCRIVGSFYGDEEGRIRFGADVDNIRTASVLKVYRPTGEALSKIASFSNGSTEDSALLEVGKVRYTETRKVIDQEAAVFINVEDFLGSKTALFGTTRSGKSNSMKTLLQKVHVYSHGSGAPVAQLILDPQGEYANTNSQDGEALANIGDASQVSIYKMMEKRSDPREKFLQFDLFKDENLGLTYQLLKSEITNGISSDANYIAPLLSQEFDQLGESASAQEKIHYRRKKLGFFALMYEGVKRYAVQPFSVNLPELVLERALESSELKKSSYSPNEILISSTADASLVAKLLLEASSSGDLNDSWKREFAEGDAGVFFDQLVEIRERGRNGVKAAAARLLPLHSSQAEGDVRDNVWRDVQAGKLIVVDLSRGSADTARVLSELIVNYLLDRASERFTDGLAPVPFQIVVEEAHNLFERDSKRSERDPWVRISKEASKYRIGLVYATQEVSSVDKRILSNTSNFLISSLNSVKETAELSNYYGFAQWAEHIRKIETKGFVRLKTQSSPYIIPVQIEKFEAKVRVDKRILSVEREANESSPSQSASEFEEIEF